MKLEMELWHLIGLVITIIGAFWTLARLLMLQGQKQIDEKFTTITTHLNTQDASIRRVERDLMDLKAELPRDYVRREDYTVAISTIMTKIDALGLRFENALRSVLLKRVEELQREQ